MTTTHSILIALAIIGGYVVAMFGYGLLRFDLLPVLAYGLLVGGGTVMGAGSWGVIREAWRNARSRHPGPLPRQKDVGKVKASPWVMGRIRKRPSGISQALP